MAKTQQSTGTTLTSEPERIPLIGTALWRNSSANKDQRFTNCFQESIKSDITNSYRIILNKRPGLESAFSTTLTGTAKGAIYWNGKYYYVVDQTLYSNTTSLQVLPTNPTRVGFIEVTNAGVAYLVMIDGTNGWRINSSDAVMQINATLSAWQASHNYALADKVIPTVSNGYYYIVTTDSGSSGGSQPTWPTSIGSTVVDSGITWTCAGEYGGFPTPHIPQPKFIDGYLLIVKSGTADIFNSDVDNIFGWGSSNFISAEMWPDNIVACARQNNQYVAFGTKSTEFFYDAAQGTAPMARNEAVVGQIGIAAPYAIYENEKYCIFVGQSEAGGRAVWMLDGFTPKKISTEHIERILDERTISSAYGYGLRVKGHLFYVLILSDLTLVYDIEEKVWHEWTYFNGTSEVTFPGVFLIDKQDGHPYLFNLDGSIIYKMSATKFTDNSTAIYMRPTTSKYDGSTMNRKFMHNLTVVGDYISTGNLQIRWTDDDYNTWSDWRTLDTRGFTPQLGSFRRRAFQILYTADADARLEFIEAEIDVGTH